MYSQGIQEFKSPVMITIESFINVSPKFALIFFPYHNENHFIYIIMVYEYDDTCKMHSLWRNLSNLQDNKRKITELRKKK